MIFLKIFSKLCHFICIKNHIFFTSQVLFLIMSKLWSVYRLEIAVPVGLALTLYILVNSLNTKTHSSKQLAGFCFENAAVKSICNCKQSMESTLQLSSECIKTKLCKRCTSFTSHPNSLCGMVWYRTLTFSQRHTDGIVLCFLSLPMPL